MGLNYLLSILFYILNTLNIGVFDVHGCCTHEVTKGEIGKMLLRRRSNVCALSETKLTERGC